MTVDSKVTLVISFSSTHQNHYAKHEHSLSENEREVRVTSLKNYIGTHSKKYTWGHVKSCKTNISTFDIAL